MDLEGSELEHRKETADPAMQAIDYGIQALARLKIARKKFVARFGAEPAPVTQSVELQSSGAASTPALASQSFAGMRKSPGEVEVLRLKEGQTLCNLAPS